MNTSTIACLDDEDLLLQLNRACASSRRSTARIIALLVYVEDRRLHIAEGFPSMFEFCVRHLQMSDGEAFRRITAARLAARFPQVLGRIENGDLHLSNLVALRDFLTEENVEELLDAVRGKSKMQVLAMLGARAPRPDASSRLRKLPTSRTAPSVTSVATGSEPLAESRYRLQATLSREGRDKLELARDLLRHRNVDADFAVVIECALDALIEDLQREALATQVPAAASGEIIERDGPQCTFVSKRGVRCCARTDREIDLVESANVGPRCRAHDGARSEAAFGPEVARPKASLRRSKSRKARRAA